VVAFNKRGEEVRTHLCNSLPKVSPSEYDDCAFKVWENRVSGYPPETMQVGDIDADGTLDIVFGTTTGFVWALSGVTGAKLPNFPVKTGEIRAPVLLAQLGFVLIFIIIINQLTSHWHFCREYHRELGNPLTIIVPSLDGFLNLVDSSSGCIERIDLGEQSYAQVLVDDVNGNGNLDLVVVTKEGNVHCLSTPSAYHALKVTYVSSPPPLPSKLAL